MNTNNQKSLRRCKHCGHIIQNDYDKCPYCGEQLITTASASETVNDQSSNSDVNFNETSDVVNNEESENTVQENGNHDLVNEVQSRDSINGNESTDDEQKDNEEPEQTYTGSNYEYSAETDATDSQVENKRKKKKLLIVCISVLVLFCAIGLYLLLRPSKLDMPITEVLSKSELQSLCDDDPSFVSSYKKICLIRESIVTEADKEKYAKITYRRMSDFLSMYSNEYYCNRLLKNAKEQYEKQCRQPILPQFNDLIKKWRKFLDDHNPDNYIQLYPQQTYTEKGFFTNVPAFWFKVAFPKGKISDCNIYASVKNLRTNIEGRGVYLNLEEILRGSNGGLVTLNNNIYNYWNFATIDIDIISVTLSNGKVIQRDDINQIPETVMLYIDDPTSENEYNVIKSEINHKYPTLEQFKSDNVIKDLRYNDPLCYELVENTNSIGEKIHRGWKIYQPDKDE